MQMVGSSDGDGLLSVLVRPTSSCESRTGEIRKKMLILEQIIFFKNGPLLEKDWFSRKAIREVKKRGVPIYRKNFAYKRLKIIDILGVISDI